MNSLLRRGLLIGLIGFLSACGFQLQGSHNWPSEWPHYRLDYSARQPAMLYFATALDRALQQRGVTAQGEPRFTIKLHRLRDTRVVAAIGEDGKAVEYELGRHVDFQILAGEWRSEVYSLSADRRMSFDPTVVLAKDVEEARLREGLARDLIELLLLRAEVDLRSLPGDA